MMTPSALRASATTLTLLIASGVAILAAGKPGGPVTTVPATMTFRCYTTSPPAEPNTPCAISGNTVSLSADHVGDEGNGLTYTGGFLGSTSAYLKVGTGRAFRLFLHQALIGTSDNPSRNNECLTSSVAACNPGPLLPFNGTSALFGDAEVNIKVLDPVTLEDSSLTAMACSADPNNPGPGSLALVHFTIWVPGGDGHWGLNFNSRAYHSTGATIWRIGSYKWVVEATTAQYAELVSFGHANIQRKQGPSHEGRYIVPLRLTVQTTLLPTGARTC